LRNSGAEEELMRILQRPGAKLCVAGDDEQR
jgi:hypothetical protein